MARLGAYTYSIVGREQLAIQCLPAVGLDLRERQARRALDHPATNQRLRRGRRWTLDKSEFVCGNRSKRNGTSASRREKVDEDIGFDDIDFPESSNSYRISTWSRSI